VHHVPRARTVIRGSARWARLGALGVGLGLGHDVDQLGRFVERDLDDDDFLADDVVGVGDVDEEPLRRPGRPSRR
jgi:hypothetical protein